MFNLGVADLIPGVMNMIEAADIRKGESIMLLADRRSDPLSLEATTAALKSIGASPMTVTTEPIPRYGEVPASVMEAKSRLMQYSQQSQFVGGKTFFQNDKQWIDAAVQSNSKARVVRIQFGSAEYFDLAATNSMALPWLALGQNVQFVLGNTIYDIYE